MQWRRRNRRSVADRTVASTPQRVVVARAMIAAPRERVWARLHRHRAALLPFGLEEIGRLRNRNARKSRRWRRLAANVNEEVVGSHPPEWYGYRLIGTPLFRFYTGQVLLNEYRPSITEVAWTIEFSPSLRGTGWLALTILDRLLDTALFRLKRELETVRCG